MKALDDYLLVGETVTLGSHRFEADEIKAFARKFDPQPFHLDESAAKASVFGGLCASGWHTAAMWMQLNIRHGQQAGKPAWNRPGPQPEFGPSPGFQKLKWLKPVYAGSTITYTRHATGHRALASRPGWHVFTIVCEAFDESGDKVMTFESSALLKAG